VKGIVPVGVRDYVFDIPNFGLNFERLFSSFVQARRAAEITFVLTHLALPMPDSFTACMISACSTGETRIEMNFPRFSFLGSIGLPTLPVVSLMVSCPFSEAAVFSAMPATPL